MKICKDWRKSPTKTEALQTTAATPNTTRAVWKNKNLCEHKYLRMYLSAYEEQFLPGANAKKWPNGKTNIGNRKYS